VALLRNASVWQMLAVGALWIAMVGYLEVRLVAPALKRILAHPPPGDYLLTKTVPGWKPVLLATVLFGPPVALGALWLWVQRWQ
jgi:hypothetical protein